MAHDEHGATVVDEPALEPRDGVEVEVIGRLVEQEHVGLLGENDAEPQPAALSPGKRHDGAREIAGRKTQVTRERGDPVLELVAVGEVVAVGDFRQPVERLVGPTACFFLGALQLLAQLDHFAEAGEKGAENVAVRSDLVGLPVEAEGVVATQDDGAGVGVELPRDETQQRRLSAAVGRHEGDALARFEVERDILEQEVTRITEAKAGDLEQGHRERRRK